jgi:hypothetical protein
MRNSKTNTNFAPYKKAIEEFRDLTGARQKFSTNEIFDFRNYAKLRTNLKLPEDELSGEQKAWKIMYLSFDKQLEEMLGTEKKLEVDNLSHEVENLGEVQKALQLKIKRHGEKDNGILIFWVFLISGFLLSLLLTNNLFLAIVLGLCSSFVGLLVGATLFEMGSSQLMLGRFLNNVANFMGSKTLKKSASLIFSKGIGLNELEKEDIDPKKISDLNKQLNDLFDKQSFYMGVTHDENVGYTKKINTLHEEMLDPSKTNEEHMRIANQIIIVVDKIAELSIAPLRKVNDEIQQVLLEIDKEIKQVTGEQKRLKLSKWFKATKDFSVNRRTLANFTISSVEWDKYIPGKIIEDKGDITVPASSELVIEMQKSSAQAKDAGSKDEKINTLRKKLSNEIFGIF